MYNLNNLLPVKVVSKNAIKPELCSLALYGNRTVGTDSWRLLEVSATGTPHEPRIVHGSFIKPSKFDKKVIKFEQDHIEATTGIVANPHCSYPDVDTILKEDTSIEYATVKVNAELLGGLLLAMSKIGKFGEVEMKVPLNQAYKPIHLYAHDGNVVQSERQTAHGLMMPMSR